MRKYIIFDSNLSLFHSVDNPEEWITDQWYRLMNYFNEYVRSNHLCSIDCDAGVFHLKDIGVHIVAVDGFSDFQDCVDVPSRGGDYKFILNAKDETTVTSMQKFDDEEE